MKTLLQGTALSLIFIMPVHAQVVKVSAASETGTSTVVEADPETDETPQSPADDIVVTAKSQVLGNNVVGRNRLEQIAASQNIVDALKVVPGVSIRGTGQTNSDPWSYGISIRGFDVNQRSSKIGQTIDGMPAHNASYYLGGTPAQKLLINENVSAVQVNQGTAGVGSPSTSALGGTIAYFTRDPSETPAGRFAVTLGDNQLRRYAAIYDTGILFGNTRAYVGLVRQEGCRWVYGCGDNSGSEQTHAEFKFVSEPSNALRLTGFVSWDESYDDPYVETTRTFLNTTDAGDGSVPSILPARPHTGTDPNQTYADAMTAVRRNTFSYLKLQFEPSDTLHFEVNPYYAHQWGRGWRTPANQLIAIDRTGTTFRRTATGGTATGSARYNAYYGAVLNGRQRPVIPGVNYIDTDGTAVNSSACYTGGTAYASNGVASFAGLNNAACVPVQAFRNSIYGQDRYGATSIARWKTENNTLEGGVWYERFNRDFGRAWRQIIDINSGSFSAYNEYQVLDFLQHFRTDTWKAYVEDSFQLGPITLSGGVQKYWIKLRGVTDAWDATGAPGPGLQTRANADSDLLFTVGATYRIDPALEAFASFSQNYGAVGDWALEKTGTDLSSLRSSVANNVDVGLRYSTPRFAATITGYHVQYDNPISFRTADIVDVNSGGYNYTAGTAGSFVNSGKGVESNGVELGFTWKAARPVTLFGSATYNVSRYQSNFVGGTASASSDRLVAKGNLVPSSPKVILNGGVELNEGPFTASLLANYQGKTAGDAYNTPELFLPKRTVVDLAATYRLPQIPGVSVQFTVNNLLNEKYIGGVLDEFSQRYTRGAPRSWAVTLRGQF